MKENLKLGFERSTVRLPVSRILPLHVVGLLAADRAVGGGEGEHPRRLVGVDVQAYLVARAGDDQARSEQ